MPALNVGNLRALGLMPPERRQVVYYESSSDSSSDDVWDLARILEESPSTAIVREFVKANVECIPDPDGEGFI